jgi:hypothetical protein
MPVFVGERSSVVKVERVLGQAKVSEKEAKCGAVTSDCPD